MSQPPPQPPPRKPLWKRLAKWVAAGLVVVIVLAWLIAPSIIAGIIRGELQSAIANRMNARLEIDDLAFHPFLSVTIGHARLLAPNQPNPIAELGGLTVSLAKLPTGRPIIVQSLVVNDPVIDLARLPSGQMQLMPSPASSTPSAPPSTGASRPFSSVLQVRHLEIHHLTVAERDAQDASQPKTLMSLDATADLGDSPSDYHFRLDWASPSVADAHVDGMADVDGRALTLHAASIDEHAPAQNALSQLPPEIQAICQQYGLVGSTAKLSIDDGAKLNLDSGSGRWKVRGLSGQLSMEDRTASQQAQGHILFRASGGGPLGGLASLDDLDPDTTLLIRADPDQTATISSSDLSQPVSGVTGTVQFTDKTLTIRDLGGNYGAQIVRLNLTAQLVANEIRLRQSRLDIADGTIQIDSAEYGLAAPHYFSSKLLFDGIDLRRVREILGVDDPQGKLSGQANGSLEAYSLGWGGDTTLLASLLGNGRVHVRNADFWDMPAFGQIASKVDSNFSSAGRVGEAAAIFEFGEGAVRFSKLVVSSPVLGIQGTGDLGLNGSLNFNAVVVPLGNWKSQLSQSPIPILGQLAGQVQDQLNQLTEKYLYSFRITGTIWDSHVEPVPAPALTAGAKNLFGKMANPQLGTDLLDLVEGKDQQPQGGK